MDDGKYFALWPKPSSEYVKDLIYAQNAGIQIIDKYKNIETQKPKCIVFDIDDTLVFGDPARVVGVREMELGEHDGQDIFILPRNEPIVKIAEHAKKCGISLIILTARPKTSKAASLTNMNMLQIPYDVLLMNDADSHPLFKIDIRRRIASKYTTILTVGDQITDVLSPGGNTAFIKLPEPESKATYVWIPPGL